MRIFIDDSKYPDRVTHLTGYAEFHRQLILAFDRLGEDVYFPPCEDELLASRVLPETVKTDLVRLNRRRCADDQDTIYLQVATPDSFRKRPGRLNVGLTMTERESLEYYTRRFDWVGLCNEMDLILTPSKWNKGIFDRSGIQNVIVTPLGVDEEFFTPAPVRFLSVLTGFGYRGSRANWQDIVECFKREFEGEKDVTLTIVSLEARRRFSYGSFGQAVRMLPKDVLEYLAERYRSPYPQVVLRDWNLGREEMRDLYRQHDCYVSYSREGWGLPTVEAMACGLQVIACDYGAPMTYLAGSPALLFDAGQLSNDNLKFENGDTVLLRGHMRSVYQKLRATREWIRQFSWVGAAERIRTLLRERHADWLAMSTERPRG